MGRRATKDRTPRQRFLAVVMAEHGASYDSIATALGVSKTTLTRWSNGADPDGVNEDTIRGAASADAG